MSRDISPELLADTAAETTTFSSVVRFARQDGLTLGFTDFDENIVYGGLTYLASSFSQTAIQTTASLSVDNLEITGILSSPFITEGDLMAGLWDHAQINIGVINRDAPAHGVIKQRKGFLGQVTANRGSFNAEVRGLMQILQQEYGRLYNAGCDANLGDARCSINLALFTFNGTVTSSPNSRVIHNSADTQPTGYYAGGVMEFLTGLNTGVRIEIQEFDAGVFSIYDSPPHPVLVGDTFKANKGCRKSVIACHEFSNVINFRGFPHVPGMDRFQSGK